MRKSLHTALICALAVLPALAEPVPPPGRVLSGTALDPQGRPVAGAAVWPAPRYDLAEDPYQAYVQAGPAMVTGADGRFTVSLPAGTDGVDICAPGSLTAQVDVSVAPSGPITVEVRPGARISGQVIDADGAPIAGMSVWTRIAGSSARHYFPRESPCFREGTAAHGVTDREGRFDLAPLEPGWYTVWAGAGPVAASSQRMHLDTGQALDGLRLVIAHGSQVAGRVTRRDGSSVPGAKVSCGGASTTTDAEGRYRLTGVAPGHNRVSAGDREHGRLDREVELAAGENLLDLVLPDPTEIRGRVLGPDGGPVAGASVKVRAARTTTAADGTFRLSIPTCGCPKTLAVHAAGLASADVEWNGEPGALEIRLARPGAIVGRVLGLRSPAGTQISATPYPYKQGPEVVADAAGRFRLPALAPGTWKIVAVQEGRAQAADVVVAPGEEKALDITFPPTYRVSGWVVDGNGRPATCDEIGFSHVTVPCRGDGTFAAELEDGSYDPWVGIGGRGQFTEPLTIDVAGAPLTRIEIRLLAPVTVAGRILGLEPGEIPDSVHAECIGEVCILRSSDGALDQDGLYRMEILPGDWEIKATFGAMTVQKRLHIPADATRIDADIAFATGPYALTGRAVGEKAFFELVDPNGFSVTSSLSEDGQFRFSRLAAGTYRLRALRSDNRLLRGIPLSTGVPFEDALLERTVQVPAPPGTELVVDLTSQ